MSKLFSHAELDPTAADYFDDGSTTVMGLAWLLVEDTDDFDGYGFLLTVDTEGAFVRFEEGCPIGLCFEKAEAEIKALLSEEIEDLKGRLLLRLADEQLERTDLIVYSNCALWVKKMTLKEFLDEFSSKANTPQGIQNEYQYDRNAQSIYRWMSGKKVVQIEKIDPLKALTTLVEWAEQDNNIEGIYSYDDPQDAIDAIEWEIRDFHDVPEYVESCKKMIEKVKALAV